MRKESSFSEETSHTGRATVSAWLPVAVACFCATLLALAFGCAAKGTTASVASPERETLQASDIVPSSASHENASTSGEKALSESSSSSVAASASAESALGIRLNPELEALSNASGMQVCTAIVDLQSGETAGYQGDVQMVSASMIKLVIVYAFLEQVADGIISLDDVYTLQSSDIVGGTGTLGSYGAGASISYREIVGKTISASDNTGANILIDAIGLDVVNQTAQDLGLTATKLQRYMMDYDAMANNVENYTSANDVAVLLQKAYSGTFVNPGHSELVMEALEAQQDAGGIASGLPADVPFAHKTGMLSSVRHDGGIVEDAHPFVIVVLCGGSGFYEGGALDIMAQIAGAAYEAVSG